MVITFLSFSLSVRRVLQIIARLTKDREMLNGSIVFPMNSSVQLVIYSEEISFGCLRERSCFYFRFFCSHSRSNFGETLSRRWLFFFSSNIMSYLHLPSTMNPSSPSSSSSSATPSSYLHVSSNGGVSTVPSSSIGSNSSSSLLGSIGGGKQWTTIGQPSSSSSTLTQQLLMKQSHLLNGPQLTSSHFDSIIGSVMGSSSQTAMEKNVIESFSCFSFSLVPSSLVRNKARRFPTVASSKQFSWANIHVDA